MDFLTIEEVAEILRVSRATIYRECRNKNIPYFKVAGAIRFDRTDIAAWIEASRVKPITHKFR